MPQGAPARVRPARRAPSRPRTDAQPRPGGLTQALDALSAVVALIGLALAARARPNYVACIFIPLALPALRLATAGAYRRRARIGLARLWETAGAYAAGGKAIPWRAALVLVAVPAALLDLSNNATVGSEDTSPVIPTAIRSISRAGPSLEELHRAGRWRPICGGGADLPYCLRRSEAGAVVSAYPAGMVPLALPVVALAHLAGADLRKPEVHARLEKLAAAGVGGAALGLFFLIALRVAPPRPALATTALLGAASGIFSTVGQGLWQHGGIILWSMAVLLVEFHGPVSRAGAVVQGAACGLMPTCRLTAVAFLAPFGAWVVLRAPRRAATLGLVAAATYLPWGLYYRAVYGSPFGPSAGFLTGSRWSPSIGGPLAGVLFSPARGLFVYQPWIALAALGLVPAIRRKAAALGRGAGPAGWVAFCVAAIVLQVAMIAAWRCWWGGYCWGSRLVVEAVPLCALLCLRAITALGTTRRGRCLVAGLGLLGFAMHAPGVYWPGGRWNAIVEVDAHPEHLWSWSHPPFLFPAVRPAPAGRGR